MWKSQNRRTLDIQPSTFNFQLFQTEAFVFRNRRDLFHSAARTGLALGLAAGGRPLIAMPDSNAPSAADDLVLINTALALEHKIEEGIAEGLSPEEARLRALRAMGGVEHRKEQMRDALRIHWLTDFVDDVRYAVRSLRRTPGLAIVVVVTLAVTAWSLVTSLGAALIPWTSMPGYRNLPNPVFTVLSRPTLVFLFMMLGAFAGMKRPRLAK